MSSSDAQQDAAAKKKKLSPEEERRKDVVKCGIFYTGLFLMIIGIVIWNFLSDDSTNVFIQMFNPTFPELEDTAPSPSSSSR